MLFISQPCEDYSISIDYNAIGVHAICRSSDIYQNACVYCQVSELDGDNGYYICQSPEIPYEGDDYFTNTNEEFVEGDYTIEEVSSYIKGIITSNVGIISEFKDKLYIIGDYKLNIVNSQSLAFYQEDVDVPTLSLELNRGEIKSLMKNANGNAAMVVYGKPELMISEYCPIGSTFGGRSKDSGCNGICSKDKFKLIDRVNEELRVMTDLYCRSYILNPVPLNIIDEIEELKGFGITTFRFDFRDETYKEVKNVISILKNGDAFDSKEYTKGHYRRGVE